MIASSDEFWRILDKRVIEPLYVAIKWIYKKSWPIVVSITIALSRWCRKKYAITLDAIKEWKNPGQRKEAEDKLMALANHFRSSIILLELTSSRYYWMKLYERKKEDFLFQQEHIELEEYGLIELVDEFVCNSRPTRLGYRVAYVIKKYGEIPPIWYPL